MKKIVITILSIIVFIACNTDDKKPVIKEFKPKKTFLNHEIINDSIEYKIFEIDEKNYTKRNLCLYKKGNLIDEVLIYKIQKRILKDEGYLTRYKKEYEVKPNHLIQVKDYTIHEYEYKIEAIDTVISNFVISPIGKVRKIDSIYNS